MQMKPVALVTGANKGIGHQIAKELAAQGYAVLIGSRSLSKGEAAAKDIGGDAHAVQLDVTDQASIDAAAARIRSDFGRLDVLVNNAAVSHAGKAGEGFPKDAMATNMLTDAPMENIRGIWDTNVFGVIAVTQAMLPLLRAAPAARIVNMGGAGGIAGVELHARQRAPRDVWQLFGFEIGRSCRVARLCLRAGRRRDQGQHCLPGPYGDSPQQLLGCAECRGRCAAGPPLCHAREGWSYPGTSLTKTDPSPGDRVAHPQHSSIKETCHEQSTQNRSPYSGQ